MQTDDLIIVSVDDHVCEPRDMFDGHVPRRFAEHTPRVVDAPDGTQQWWYGDRRGRSVGLDAAAGKSVGEMNTDACRYDDMRPGCYDVHQRVEDMNRAGVLGSLNFPNWTGFSGQVLNQGPDPDVNEVMIRAYNDWLIEDWCGAYPDRFIPSGIVPYFDAERAAREVRRLADKGCHAVIFSEKPSALGMPSIYSDAWDPFFAACDELGTILCLHLGSASIPLKFDREAPGMVVPAMSPIRSVYTLGELLWAPFWWKFPNIKASITEGDMGWMPFFVQRACRSLASHSGWANHHYPSGKTPEDIFRERIICCLIDDEIGVELLSHFNVDNVCWELDYPHSDSVWPRAPEVIGETLAGVDDADVQRITHLNTMKHYQFHPFATRTPQQCTVRALRSRSPSG